MTILINDVSTVDSIDAPAAADRKALPTAGIYQLVAQATDFDDGNVNVFLEVNHGGTAVTYGIVDSVAGTAVGNINSDTSVYFRAPHGAKIYATGSDPTGTGYDGLTVAVFYVGE
jgi:hypothetical protein